MNLLDLGRSTGPFIRKYLVLSVSSSIFSSSSSSSFFDNHIYIIYINNKKWYNFPARDPRPVHKITSVLRKKIMRDQYSNDRIEYQN